MNKEKIIGGMAAVAIVLAILAILSPRTIINPVEKAVEKVFGGVTNYDTLQLGPNGLEAIATTPQESCIVVNGKIQCVVSGVCADATTTLANVANPIATSSMVTFWQLEVTQAGTGSPLKLYIGTTTQTTSATSTTANGGMLLTDTQIPVRRVQIWNASSTQGQILLNSYSSTTVMSGGTNHHGYNAVASSTDITDMRIASSTFGITPQFAIKGGERVAFVVDDTNSKADGAALSGG